jgi:hypothetical protein
MNKRHGWLLPRDARWHNFKTKIPIWVNFGVKDVGKYYVHLVYFTANSYIFGHLVHFVITLVYFSRFWYVVTRPIWQPCCCRGVRRSRKPVRLIMSEYWCGLHLELRNEKVAHDDSFMKIKELLPQFSLTTRVTTCLSYQKLQIFISNYKYL